MPVKRGNKLFLIASKIKKLREQMGLTQNELARKVGITRSGVNGWETEESVPSTQNIVELSDIFKVSTDYLLGVDEQSLKVDGLNDKEIASLMNIIECYKTNKIT